MLSDITPLILTYNEEDNLQRTLERLAWARQILIIDSGSTDRTLDIARQFSQCEILSREFDSFADQCNFGLQHIRTSWVLSLDADYVCGVSLSDELEQLSGSDEVSGYQAAFRYCVHGKPLRSSLYPPRTILYRKNGAHYVNDGHGHRVVVPGRIKKLHTRIDHDDRKPLSRWLSSQDRYAKLEAEKLLAANPQDLSLQDRLRLRILPAPVAAFLYALLVRGLILDGWQGWHYCFQRLLAEVILSLRLMEARLFKSQSQASRQPALNRLND